MTSSIPPPFKAYATRLQYQGSALPIITKISLVFGKEYGEFFLRKATLLIMLSITLETLAHNDIDLQIHEVTHAIEKQPDKAELYVKRAELYRHRDKFNAALDDLKTAQKHRPESPMIQLAFGRLYHQMGDLEKAEASLSAYLKTHPIHEESLILRARARAMLEKPEGALADYNQALDNNVLNRPGEYLERAKLLEAASRIDEALAGLDFGLHLLGVIPALQEYAISLELKLGNTASALDRLTTLIKVSNGHPRWQMMKGQLLHKTGRMPEAEKTLQAAKKRVKDLPPRRKQTKAMRSILNEIEDALNKIEIDRENLTVVPSYAK